MPEGPEVDSDKLHEAIQEELEQEGGGFLRAIAITTALFAAIAAIGSLRAGATVNEALLLKTEATQFQAQASDQWAYHQAKGLKASMQEASQNAWLAAGKTAPAQYEQNRQRYLSDQKTIDASARELEKKRDEKSAEADHLLHRHHGFANSVALMQVAIALGALAALTRFRAIWWMSLLLGLAGTALFAITFV